MFVYIYIYNLYFKTGTVVANQDRRHLRFIQPHDDGPMKHEGKPRRELYEKVDKQADISDFALFLDEHEEMLERRSGPNCGQCNYPCNPCAYPPNTKLNKLVCECRLDINYCIKEGKECKVNATLLLVTRTLSKDSNPLLTYKNRLN